MKISANLLHLLLLAAFPILAAEPSGTLIFSDNFDRNESQEETEEIGNGWTTASKTRAKGNKQVDLRDGAMHIYIHPVADHAVSVRQPLQFRDGAIAIRFKLEDPKDQLGINFADLKEKSVWAGHLFKAVISKSAVEVTDLKTGIMNLEIRAARKAKSLTRAQEKHLKSTSKKFRHNTKIDKWHSLLIEIEDSQLTVTINNKTVGTFQSEGIAHDTKTLLRLSVPRQAVVDDVKIYRRN
ncbi:MAG: hypothetical protein AAGD22_18115 [Verrucomicrobiota bacterium]